MRRTLAVALAFSWTCLGPACSGGDGDTGSKSAGGGEMIGEGPAMGLPKLGRVEDAGALPDDRTLDFTFPDTLCGNLVQRLLECEIERIRNQPTLQENEKKSVISNKRRTFAQKREKYLSHCQGKVAGLPEKAVRSCLPMPCVEMDRCLQKISGQTDPK